MGTTEHRRARRLQQAEAAKPKPPTGVRWIIACSYAGQERVAKWRFEEQGFEVYLPMRELTAKNRLVSAAPFFPRYLFVRVDFDHPRWRAVYSTIGVHQILARGDWPAIVPDTLIDRIKGREVGGLVRMPEPEDAGPAFQSGDVVRFKKGRLETEVEAIFMERVDGNRALLLVSLLGRDSHVLAYLDQLTG